MGNNAGKDEASPSFEAVSRPRNVVDQSTMSRAFAQAQRGSAKRVSLEQAQQALKDQDEKRMEKKKRHQQQRKEEQRLLKQQQKEEKQRIKEEKRRKGPATPKQEPVKCFIPINTKVTAVYDYQPKSKSELQLKQGDVFVITNSENENWWEAQPVGNSDIVGWVPSNYVVKLNSLDSEPYYHGRIPRTTAEFFLSNGINGSFLVRESQSNAGEHTISLRCDGKVFHYRISRTDKGVFIAADRVFSTVQDLVKFYHQQSDGLVHPLRHAVPKNRQEITASPSDKWEIDRSSIMMGTRLGAGQYGEVYEAVLTNKNRHVAVKTLKEEAMEAKDFLKEAEVMKKLKHPNLVELIGVCTLESPLYIVTEYMCNGCLLDYIRDPIKQKEITPTAMMYIAEQISAGMEFLESQNFIHRDLAARNCLVADNLLVKLADFGLARLLYSENEYEAKSGAKFPIKWTAPESLNFNTFSTKSDVWAFGICMWEIVTLGETPYPGMDLYDVIDKLQHKYRMPRPEGCPVEVYQLMLDCWEEEAQNRPTFHSIRRRLNTMYEGKSIEEQVQKMQSLERGVSLADMKEFDPEQDIHGHSVGMQANDRKELETRTKRIVKQAHHIINSGEEIELDSAIGVLVSDTSNLSVFVELFVSESGDEAARRAWDELNNFSSQVAHAMATSLETVEGRKQVYKKVRDLAKRVVCVKQMLEG
uniref:non-specific protein-tyrosine kinase n=1 Tax=Hartaetosiga gracilis TaxID=216892 RepID=B3XVY8_9EUKA|nr:protein tyrosine kinase abl [Hartaetosiga gracilis]